MFIFGFCVILILSILPIIFLPAVNDYCDCVSSSVSCADAASSEFCTQRKGAAVAGVYLLFVAFGSVIVTLVFASVRKG